MKITRPRAILGGRYVLEREVGRGTKASVWLALDRVLDRPVAVKILGSGAHGDPAAAERLASGLAAAAAITHPGIVPVFDTGEEGGVPYIVTEWVEGETLRALLSREGALQPGRAVSLLLPVLSALRLAHRAGLAHGDLKPENILVGGDGRVRLTDFGLSTAAVREGAASADLEAAGAILYEALTGHAPAGEPRGTPLHPGAVRAGVPRALDVVVMRALAPAAAGGFTSADEFGAALERAHSPAAAAGEAVAPTAARARPSAFRSWMLLPLLLVAVAGGVIALALLLGRLPTGSGSGPSPEPPAPETQGSSSLLISGVKAFDPLGDGRETDDAAELAADGDEATAWHSENYFDGVLNKAGVGLLFDLGQEREVTEFRLATPAPGFDFEVRVGDDPGLLAETPGEAFTAEAATRGTIAPVRGRFVLLWMTSVVPTGDGNRATVAEFRILGSDG